MKILLDENLPDSLVEALQALGHPTDSINRLHLKGIDNGTLYQQVARGYDLCFTRDAGFVQNVRHMRQSPGLKLLRVVIPQQAAKSFVIAFVKAFRGTEWSRYRNGDDWP